MTHFYRRCAGAQNGEPPPLSPPRRRGTTGRENKYFKVGGLRFLQALTTPRALLSVYSCQPIRAPFPHRERGWGERADTPVATLGAILCAVRIDFGLPSKINPYPAQPATGVLGQRPKRVLVPFTRVKGTPRRRAVQAATLWWLLPAAGAYNPAPAGQAYRLKPFVKLPPPISDYKPYHAPAHNPYHLHPSNPKTGNPHHPIKPKGARP